jgi:hypothetical protein
MADNFVLVEAEDLPYNTDYWTFQNAPSGFGGSGWLLNTRDEAQGGDACHAVATHEGCLTPEQGWLKIPVYIDEVQGQYGGVFSIDLRCWRGKDGDGANDIWVGVEDYQTVCTNGVIANRIGRSHRGYGHMWGPLSPETEYEIVKIRIPESNFGQVINFFVSPRSSSRSTDINQDVIGVDRVLIYFCPFKTSSTSYDDSNIDFPMAAWNINTPATQLSDPAAVSVQPSTRTLTVHRTPGVYHHVSLAGRTLRVVNGQPVIDGATKSIRVLNEAR